MLLVVWQLSRDVIVRECTDVSYVAGEGLQLAVHKESVVVEESVRSHSVLLLVKLSVIVQSFSRS